MTLARARSLGDRDPVICLLGSLDCSGKEGPRNRKHQSAPLDDGLTDRPKGVAPNFMKQKPAGKMTSHDVAATGCARTRVSVGPAGPHPLQQCRPP